MAPSPHSLKFVVTVIFIFCFPSNSVFGSVERYSSNSEMGLEDMQKVLGSRPPRCVNRCLNCKPCMATLVSPSQQHGDHKGSKFNFRPASLYKQEDDTYYLLSWKCRCGDKLFEP